MKEKWNSQNTSEVASPSPKKMEELIPVILNEAKKFEIKENDRNEKGELLVSPDGPVSNLGKQSELWWKIARTESFKNFFGDWQSDPKSSSKIVDKNGEPLVLFRGLMTDISLTDFYNKEFYYKKGYYTQGIGKGVYVTAIPEVANKLGNRNKGGVLSLFANTRKPKYKENLRSFLLQELEDITNRIILYIPKKIIKKIPEISFTNHDSVYGYRRFNVKSKNEIPTVEEFFEVLIKDPQQLLIIPNPIKKIEEPVRTVLHTEGSHP